MSIYHTIYHIREASFFPFYDQETIFVPDLMRMLYSKKLSCGNLIISSLVWPKFATCYK